MSEAEFVSPDTLRVATDPEPTVFLVDQDDEMRAALAVSLCGLGLQVESFASGELFLLATTPSRSGCLLVDFAAPGRMNGTEIQDELVRRNWEIPIISLSDRLDGSLSSYVEDRGVFAILEKPVDLEILKRRIKAAFEYDRERNRDLKAVLKWRAEVSTRFSRLPDRERDIMRSMVSGRSNEAVASLHDIGEPAFAFRRARILHHMRVSSIRQLISLVTQAELFEPA